MDATRKERILKHGPIGVWRSSAGTFDVVMGEKFVFHADGTGRNISYSALSGEDAIDFEWAMLEKGKLRMREIWPEHADETSPGEEENPESAWQTVDFEFRHQQHDAGSQEVLAGVGQEGFWWAMSPLRWVSEIDGDSSPGSN